MICSQSFISGINFNAFNHFFNDFCLSFISKCEFNDFNDFPLSFISKNDFNDF